MLRLPCGCILDASCREGHGHAPELLEALESALRRLEQEPVGVGPEIAKARAAIAKARGGDNG
jgi:hypothetical protein